jgi:hypothetical protein
VLDIHVDQLKNSILSAQIHEDIDVYRIASQRFDDLMEEIQILPTEYSISLENKVYEMLPSDWVYSMEVCRCEGKPSDESVPVIH